jgi:hypothetical protein
MAGSFNPWVMTGDVISKVYLETIVSASSGIHRFEVQGVATS